MRKGLSLIELVFTIVIIAVVFTVIPKIVLALSKSDEFTVKQDAVFNGMTMMQMISRLSWDENSTNSNDILDTNSTNFKCDTTTHYRVGGFRGSRNCENNVSIFGILGSEEGNATNLYDDIDDFHNKDINTSLYRLHVEVKYIADNITYVGQNANIGLIQTSIPTSTNLKMVDMNITYAGNKASLQGKPISQFTYVSSNIGKFFIGKRTW